MDKYVVFENKKYGKLYIGKLKYSTTNQDVVYNLFNSDKVNKKQSYAIDKIDVIDDYAIQEKFPKIKSVFDSIGSLTDEFEEQSNDFKTDFEKLKQDYEKAEEEFAKANNVLSKDYKKNLDILEAELERELDIENKKREKIRENKDNPDESNTFYTNEPRGPDVRSVFSFKDKKRQKNTSHFKGGKKNQKSKMKTKKKR